MCISCRRGWRTGKLGVEQGRAKEWRWVYRRMGRMLSTLGGLRAEGQRWSSSCSRY